MRGGHRVARCRAATAELDGSLIGTGRTSGCPVLRVGVSLPQSEGAFERPSLQTHRNIKMSRKAGHHTDSFFTLTSYFSGVFPARQKRPRRLSGALGLGEGYFTESSRACMRRRTSSLPRMERMVWRSGLFFLPVMAMRMMEQASAMLPFHAAGSFLYSFMLGQ